MRGSGYQGGEKGGRGREKALRQNGKVTERANWDKCGRDAKREERADRLSEKMREGNSRQV